MSVKIGSARNDENGAVMQRIFDRRTEQQDNAEVTA